MHTATGHTSQTTPPSNSWVWLGKGLDCMMVWLLKKQKAWVWHAFCSSAGGPHKWRSEFSQSGFGLRPTCPCGDAERVKAGVKQLRQFQFHFEGLASPHDQLLLRDLAGVVFGVVAFALDVRSHKDWENKTDMNESLARRSLLSCCRMCCLPHSVTTLTVRVMVAHEGKRATFQVYVWWLLVAGVQRLFDKKMPERLCLKFPFHISWAIQ